MDLRKFCVPPISINPKTQDPFVLALKVRWFSGCYSVSLDPIIVVPGHHLQDLFALHRLIIRDF